MADILIRKTGHAGRITLNRPRALNSLTYEMCLQIEAAIDDWANDDSVQLVIIDAVGEKAFCAGGDIVQLYETGRAGDFEFGQKFWADEYRLNQKIFNFPKPYVAFMQGFTMGGGVGISCHGSHRIVGNSSKIAMPECAIGLVPDVGGSLLLARAPGRVGEYLGTTGTRMAAQDAIYAEFADYFIPEEDWPALIAELSNSGDYEAIDRTAISPPEASLSRDRKQIDRHFGGETIGDILRSLQSSDDEFCQRAVAALRRQSPLSIAVTTELIHRVRGLDDIERALELEYRFTARAAEHGDLLEGIRAAVIEKGSAPNWRHPSIEDVSLSDVSKMLRPLGDEALRL